MLVYVKNCIFQQTDKIFPVTGPPSETLAPTPSKAEMLELPLPTTPIDYVNCP